MKIGCRYVKDRPEHLRLIAYIGPNIAYSVLAALFLLSTHNKQEAVPYKKLLGRLVLDKTDFPMPLNSDSKFETENDLAINVFCLEKTKLYHFICLKTIKIESTFC